MPKMKTKSGAKKRFRVTGGGHIKFGVAYKRHNLRKRPMSMKRKARGTEIMSERDQGLVMQYMPYDR